MVQRFSNKTVWNSIVLSTIKSYLNARHDIDLLLRLSSNWTVISRLAIHLRGRSRAFSRFKSKLRPCYIPKMNLKISYQLEYNSFFIILLICCWEMKQKKSRFLKMEIIQREKNIEIFKRKNSMEAINDRDWEPLSQKSFILDGFSIEISVTEIEKAAWISMIFNHLNWKPFNDLR